MKNHTKTYLKAYGYDGYDDNEQLPYIPCQVCGDVAVDINHIEPRGMGGSKQKDDITNLIGMCRRCHLDFEAKKISKEELKEIVNFHLKYKDATN
jgi:5-methylcytosine-specific restriction endonuclease McrA